MAEKAHDQIGGDRISRRDHNGVAVSENGLRTKRPVNSMRPSKERTRKRHEGRFAARWEGVDSLRDHPAKNAPSATIRRQLRRPIATPSAIASTASRNSSRDRYGRRSAEFRGYALTDNEHQRDKGKTPGQA